MGIIDVHCHIYPAKIAAKAVESVGNFYDTSMSLDGTAETLIAEAEKAGIEKCVIHSVATTPKQVASINRFISEEQSAHPDMFFGFGTLHPDSENMEYDIDELVSLGLHGVKLHPDIQGFKLDDFRCLSIYSICEKKGLPVLIHAGDSRYDFSNPNRLCPILEIYDNLTVIGAHFAGYSMWEEASRLCAGIKNLYVDCSSSLYALSDEKAVEIIRRYGADRVLFGTDYPMWSPAEEVERVKRLGLTEEEKELILHLNAEKLLLAPK